MKAIHQFNFSRLLLNLLFTGLLAFVSIQNNDKQLAVGYILLYNLLLFVPAWINTFLLFPHLRHHKKMLRYLLEATMLLLSSVFLLGQYLQGLYTHFEKSELTDFTPLAIHISVPPALAEYQAYFDVCPGILFLMLILAMGYVVQEYKAKLKKEEIVQAQQNIAELALLKSQISPHFLFNILNSLYALSLKTAKETPAVILQLSDILRYSLYESQEKESTIGKEIHIIQTYLAIEQLRIPSTTRVSFQCEEVKDTVKIAPMLLLPLIENAFKHGIDSTVGSAYIEAHLYCDDHRLLFTCTNSFKEQPTKGIGGIGIDNIRKRLQLLYPAQHLFQIKKNINTFSVTLEIKF